MIKRIITIVLTSSLISAGLLYLGFSVLSRTTPAYASSQDALVAGTKVQTFTGLLNAVENELFSARSQSAEDQSESSGESSSDSSSTQSSSQSESSSSTSTSTPATSITIAELLNDPGKYDDAMVSVTGIATTLNDEEFLLNDGTGQLLVELEEEDDNQVSFNGLTITVVGKFEDSSNSLSPELEAFTILYQGQIIWQVEDIEDSPGDDDDGDDDMEDDDDLDDDDMDDQGDDSGDDDGDDMDDDTGGSDDDSDSSDDHSGSDDSDD